MNSSMNANTSQPYVNLQEAFPQTIYDVAGQKLRFIDLFVDKTEGDHTPSSLSTEADTPINPDERDSIPLKSDKRLLVVFIRHFFCGNCQEYLRCLAANQILSAANLAKHNITVSIIGCGAPSLIESYRAVADIPSSWELFADPSTELYRILGMHRTLSLGDHNPKYIRRSLAGNMMRSVMQGIRRIPQGDVLAAGSWDVNGGEFLFKSRTPPSLASKPDSWTLEWCHRMRNSRDHTEVDDLLVALGLTSTMREGAFEAMGVAQRHVRSCSIRLPCQSDSSLDEKCHVVVKVKRKPSLRKSLSVRRQSLMHKSSVLARSMSMRVTSPT